jgi:hypothetical protein
MAGQRLTDKSALAENLANDDLLMAVDVSDTTGSAAGTSKKVVSKYIIQTDKVVVSNAELQAMDATGGAGTFKELIPAQGSGYIAIPLKVTIIPTVSDADDSNATLYLGWDASQEVYEWDSAIRFNRNATSSYTYIFFGNGGSAITHNASIDNLSFKMYSSANFNSTDAIFNTYVTYQVVKL